MLRELQVQEYRPAPAVYKADTDMTVGMGVVIDEENGVVKFPSAAASANIFVVDKERAADGAANALTQFSDYYEDFMTIKKGELVKLHAYARPDRFATDQVDAEALAEAEYMAVGTDGKWTASKDATQYKYIGTYKDAGHTLYEISLVEI